MSSNTPSGHPPGWPAPKLAGKTFFFARMKYHRSAAAELVRTEGGEVLPEVTAALDFLVVGTSGGGKPTGHEKKAEKLIQKGAGIQVLNEGEFCKLFLPTREEALALLTAGEEGQVRWARLCGNWWVKGQVDLRGVKLRGAELKGVSLRNAVLEGSDLREVDFGLMGCLDDLERVRLDGARLVDGRVYGARNCRLKGANLEKAYVVNVTSSNLDEARLVQARVEQEMVGCSLRKADLTEATIWSANFEKSDLTGACLKKVQGTGAKGAEAIARNADLTGARLDRASFPKADFTGADLRGANLEEAVLSRAKLVKAKLVKADLTKANLTGANLSKADLREANLADADLTNARVDGATFEGANLTGAKLAGVDLPKARGVERTHRAAGQMGPKVRELEAAVKQAERFEMEATLDVGDGPVTVRVVDQGPSHWPDIWEQRRRQYGYPRELGKALLALAKKWAAGTLRLESLKVKATKCPVPGHQLRRLVMAAWCEARGEAVPSREELRERKAARAAGEDESRARLVGELRSGPKGVESWNARRPHERKQAGHFREVDLSGAELAAVNLEGLDFQGANFQGANLTGAKLERGRFPDAIFQGARLGKGTLAQANFRRANIRGANLEGASGYGAHFHGADFTGASLAGAHFSFCSFRGAALREADVCGADLGYSDLRQADLSSARLDGARLEEARYDERTHFPTGFRPPKGMKWAGTGPLPGSAAKPPVPAGPLDFEHFLNRLKGQVDPARLDKALAMLKAERFQLYASVDPGAVVGVVKSQRDVDLVYSCRLAADGSFACCTQNLHPCGGLRGAPCKHILVLLIGLTKGGRLDPGTVDRWVQASRRQRPALDRDVMSEVLLRYKGVEAGEVDWRPTETIPEDFYAL